VPTKGACGLPRNHAIHTVAIGLPGAHDWKTCKVPAKPKEQKPIAARSDKMDAFYKNERIPLVELVIARANGQCEIQSPWCDRISDWNPITVHEIATRGREGGIMAPGVNTPENCVAACLYCNRAMSENADWAEEHGFLKPASAVVETPIE
jgi:hypothetical protein